MLLPVNLNGELSHQEIPHFIYLAYQLKYQPDMFILVIPKREYDILGNQLEFKKIALKNIGFKYAESALLVQAITSLGKDNISAEIIAALKQKIDSKLYPKIIKDTKTVTDWVYSVIKQVCQD